MKRSHFITLGIGLALGLTLAALSESSGQPGGGFRPTASSGQIGRYQIAYADTVRIIILDTTTGELYRSKESEWKSFDKRPSPPQIRFGDGFGKDEKDGKEPKDGKFEPKDLKEKKDDLPRDKTGKIELKFTPDEIKKLFDEKKQ